MDWVARSGSHCVLAMSASGQCAKCRYLLQHCVLYCIDFRSPTGTTIGWLARKLRLQRPSPATDQRFSLDILPAGEDQSQVAEITVGEGPLAEGTQLVSLHLPREAHVMLVTRKNEHLVPRGSTTLRAGDVLSILADRSSLARVRSVTNPSPSVTRE